MIGITITLFLSTLFFTVVPALAVDTITANQSIRDDGSSNGIIESVGGNFELGFFSPGSSKNRYVGIWYKKISKRTVVWVANRQTPLNDASGAIRIDANGSLALADGAARVIWTSNSSRSMTNSPVVAQLLDNGNLVVRYTNEMDTENYLWQSFDHPTDNILPGMKLGWDFGKGLERYPTSWKSDEDPSPGDFTLRVDVRAYPQILLYKDSNVQFRFGPWDGVQFNGLDFSVPEPSFEVKTFSEKNEMYYSYAITNPSVVMRMVLPPDGNTRFIAWNDQTQTWENSLIGQRDVCDQYAFCGAYGTCDSRKSGRANKLCGCLQGYVPKFPEQWKLANWTNGCVPKDNSKCGGDQFVKYSGRKLPDTQHTWFDNNMNIDDCKNMCLNNCSCKAYSNIDIRQHGIGCMLWLGDLIDIRDFSGDGLDFYLRVAASELETKSTSGSKRGVLIAAVTVLSILLLLIALLILRRKRMLRRKGILELNPEGGVLHNSNEMEHSKLPLFGFIAIAEATNNFSINNKLGQGGFGPVYKGTLDDGQEVAVKRLSKDSRQGLDEFKNEVSYIAKLQHRNLVRLLGCCIMEEEMMLIYEYMPNKSLDSLLFDQERSKALDWPKRYNIISGIARGLLYLHQDSGLRIIHRDLKASNILLDYDMNARISDFGMAKSFEGCETEANTTRVVGTYGYMSPEYALDGTFSVKSDVYSFGVLVLEIVSGRKMRRFYNSDESLNLLNYAWKLYTEDKLTELIDGAMRESYDQFEASRVIQIALLCVNTYPEQRPSMSTVVSMMTTITELPKPAQPGVYTRFRTTTDPSTSQSISADLSVTLLGSR